MYGSVPRPKLYAISYRCGTLFAADEIPQGLQLIANGAGHKLMLGGEKLVRWRVVVMSLFRLIVGYLFLSSLFVNIAQNNDVIEIFYDVLALEFVENIDDTSFALGEFTCIRLYQNGNASR